MTNTAGTNYFLAPECDDDSPYNAYAVDVGLADVDVEWYFGVVTNSLSIMNFNNPFVYLSFYNA